MKLGSLAAEAVKSSSALKFVVVMPLGLSSRRMTLSVGEL